MKKERSKRRDEDTDDDEDRTTKKKSKRSDELADLQDMWGDGEGGDEGGDDRYDKLKEGKNIRRILPRKDPDEPFFLTFAIHFNMGPDGEDKFRCIEPNGPFGHSKKKDKQRAYRAKLCPACKMYCRNKSKARKFEFGSKEGKAYWRKHVAPWRAKLRFVWAQNPPKAKERADRRKAFVFETGIMIAKPLIEAFYDKDMGGDFTDPKTGRIVIITKTKLGQAANEVEYDTRISPNRTPLKTWKRLRKRLPDLETFLPEKLEPDAIIAIMEGDGLPDDDDDAPRSKKKRKGNRDRDDDDDLDDADDEDDEDEGGGRRHKLARRKRRDDEDVDPDAEEEDDDDEDEAPRKKKGKKSKMRDKLSKKARRDDDDDEDEDDSDDEGDDDEDEDADDEAEDDDSEDDDEDEDDADEDEEDDE